MDFLFILNLIVAILLIIVILIQNKGTGLSSVFGGGGEIIMEKRGVEKFIHKLTIILAILFCTISISFLFVNNNQNNNLQINTKSSDNTQPSDLTMPVNNNINKETNTTLPSDGITPNIELPTDNKIEDNKTAPQ